MVPSPSIYIPVLIVLGNPNRLIEKNPSKYKPFLFDLKGLERSLSQTLKYGHGGYLHGAPWGGGLSRKMI